MVLPSTPNKRLFIRRMQQEGYSGRDAMRIADTMHMKHGAGFFDFIKKAWNGIKGVGKAILPTIAGLAANTFAPGTGGIASGLTNAVVNGGSLRSRRRMMHRYR